MERVGRKPQKLNHVDKFSGSDQAKEKLRWMLATLSGEATIPEACRALQINESWFHEMRNHWLQAALGCLEPARVGRPPKQTRAEAEQVRQLQAQIEQLRAQLQVAELRVELGNQLPRDSTSKKKG